MHKRFPAVSLPGVLLAGITFVVLYLIIGVALWVAFVATGGALLAYGAAAALARGWAPSGAVSGGTEEPALHVNPIVDVGVLRARYLVTLGLALTGGFLVVDSFAFSTGTATAISFALGIAVAAVAVAFYLARVGATKQVVGLLRGRMHVAAWDLLALAVGAIGAWNIVQTQVFAQSTVKWLTFADGLGLLGLTLGGLVLHELSTERVVHALEVVGSAIGSEQEPKTDREPARAA